MTIRHGLGRTLACGLITLGLWGLGYAGSAATAPDTAGLRLQPLSGNAQVEQAAGGKTGVLKASKSETEETSVLLPFFDDFSYNGPYPDPMRWADRSVFINNAFAFYPPSYGVATFDAIDSEGALYRHGGLGVSFSADTLTSRPIRLDSVFTPYPRALSTDDSIILSFYYQPGGGWGSLWDSTNRGQSPNRNDRLLLEFYSEELSMWVQMWSSDGMSLSEFCPLLDSTGRHEVQDIGFFRYVEVPITTPGFNKRDFRFRFRAYSSIDRDLRTGGGQWHIDYVYLNYGRTPGRTRQTDVAFVEAASTLTAPYTQVPWRQFDAADICPKFDFTLNHLGAEAARIDYQYALQDADGENIYTSTADGAAGIIYPFVQRGYTTEPVLSPAAFGHDFAGEAWDGPQTYRLAHIVRYRGGLSGEDEPIADFCPRNDTLAFLQTFGDEFAYDDGTAEAGIGTTYAGGTMAVSFTLREPDTLTALRLFFNRSYNDANSAAFSICIWRAVPGDRDEGYIPDALLYESDWIYPVFEDGLNRFYTYNIGEGGYMLPQGRFFVGIRQSGNTFLNLGFDQNNDARAYTHYYYLDDGSHEWRWRPLLYRGALMLRPAFGTAARQPEGGGATRRETVAGATPTLHVYPNPLQDGVLHIDLPDGWTEAGTHMTLSAMDGRICRQSAYRPEWAVGGLEAGIYVLRIVGAGGEAHAKIVIR
ncbi:MAG: T9SS type A sorting domain-containing protein [Bacteroidales bacterium]|nr:T9SS type A sorting domain-containing protein [Bacteroidales bacterium]